MMMQGRVSFFNESDGVGIIINSQEEEIDFDIRDWDDFEVMPCPDLEIEFNVKENKAFNIVSNQNDKDIIDEPYTTEDLDEISLTELKEIASEDFEIDNAYDMKRADLIEAILKLQNEDSDADIESEPYTIEDLDEISLSELKEIAGEDFEIDNAYDMKRADLIEAILKIQRMDTILINGTIFFFNESDGKGIILTSENEKIDFDIKEWDDFENRPFTGLEVVFILENNIPTNIVTNDINKEYYTVEKETSPSDKENISACNFCDVEESEDNNLISFDDLYICKDCIACAETMMQSDDSHPLSDKNKELIGIVTNIITPKELKGPIELQSPDNKKNIYIIPPKRLHITCSLDISQCLEKYFSKLKKEIDTRSAYKKIKGEIDYILAKRFLKTTFNNLIDIDLNIITPKIEKLNKELIFMDYIYSDFNDKTNYLTHAYDEVFLSFQPEYKSVKKDLEHIINKLNGLKASEQLIGNSLAAKKVQLEENINTSKYAKLENEFKHINGLYADTIHDIAELDERRKYDLKLVHTFEEQYRIYFNKSFKEVSLLYRKQIIEILNALAYIVDEELWKEAKTSEAIKMYFKDSIINHNLNTQTYLKYYLDALDAEKANAETTKLFELYEYLQSIHKECVLIVMSSTQEALEHDTTIRRFNDAVDVKAFTDEKMALKWAIANHVTVLILEDTLRQTTSEKFLHVYKKHVFCTPKIIILGNKPKSSPLAINKLLSKNISSKIISNNVNILLKEG